MLEDCPRTQIAGRLTTVCADIDQLEGLSPPQHQIRYARHDMYDVEATVGRDGVPAFNMHCWGVSPDHQE